MVESGEESSAPADGADDLQRITVRLSRNVHKALLAAASERAVSMNAEINRRLELSFSSESQEAIKKLMEVSSKLATSVAYVTSIVVKMRESHPDVFSSVLAELHAESNVPPKQETEPS